MVGASGLNGSLAAGHRVFMRTGEWSAIVMAAGKGKRMRSALPKAMHSVAGMPMPSHVARSASQLGMAQVLMVVPPGVREQLSASAGESVEWVEQPDPLGTGHALLTAFPFVSPNTKQLLLLNGDAPLLRPETLQTLMQTHTLAHAALSLLTAHVELAQANDLGQLLRDEHGAPMAVREAQEAEGRDGRSVEANVGAYCLDAAWVRGSVDRLTPHASGELYVTDLAALAREDGKTVATLALESSAEGLGVNTRAQLAEAEAAIQGRLRAYWMDRGVTLQDPATTYFHVDVQLGEDVLIRPSTHLLGRTRIGQGAQIGPNAHLTDAVVGEGSKVGSSTLDGVVLEGGVSVGPYCHLRPGTHLERGVVVGSHVEIKNSYIGSRTHVAHFCYIGDATVGADVNMGAGAVTCNFDGVEKHRTEIEEGAFIGSDTMLVAPVRVGARAITAAGAVVTNDVLPGTTVAGVPARLLERRKESAPEAAFPKEG